MSIPAGGERPAAQVKLPEGCLIRGCLPGDEESWIALLGLCGFDGWDRRRFDEYMDKPERKEGSRLVLLGGRVLAATFAGRGDVEANVGRVDYVVSHPGFRGRGLGRAVCAGVLDYLLGRGYETVELFTDDWRLSAIGLYLSLGLTPDMTSVGMSSRWEAVMERLAASPPR